MQHYIKPCMGRDWSCITAGHIYYFLEDVYPRMSGRRLLKTPGFVTAMFNGGEEIRHIHRPRTAAAPEQQPPPRNAGFAAPGVVPQPGANPGEHDRHFQSPKGAKPFF